MSYIRSFALLFAVGICAATDLSKWRQDGYFGKQTLKDGQAIPKDNTEVRPFNISMSDSELADLKSRLANARFIEHLPGTAFNYGMSADELRKVVSYWNSTYDWRKQEAYLNSFPQYKTQIEGIDVHFVRVKASPKAKTVIPLFTVHGWPSSFMEAYKAIPSLIEPDADGVAFEVIAPSIPGYGYSEPAHQVGMDYTNMARVFHKLTQRLGHKKVMLQGGDWGGPITQAMAVLYPENTIGIHALGSFDSVLNLISLKRLARFLLTPHPGALLPSEIKRSIENLRGIKDKLVGAFEETGILHQSATKPDTTTAALIDSPVGMAAHILEKYSTYVNDENRNLEDGGLTQKWTLDELLNIVMIYWTSGNIHGTARIYKELLQVNSGVVNEKVMVPAGVIDAEHEVIRSSKAQVEGNYARLLQYIVLPNVGHFEFFEAPKLVEDSLRSLMKKILTPKFRLF